MNFRQTIIRYNDSYKQCHPLMYPDYNTLKNIKERHDCNLHKVHAIDLPAPHAKTRHWEREPYESGWAF